MGLTPRQKSARISLERILQEYRGAVLHGDMGVGKTWIACDVASKYDKVLFVCQAKALKSLEKKIELYEQATGNYLNVDLISYHKFSDYKKISAKYFSKFDFFIFDESHVLKNYKAQWTTRYVKMNKGKYLHLTGTPLTKSPKDFLYVLRKCGLFESTEWFYKRYFNAKKSYSGNYWEMGEFRNAECYQNHVDRVTIRLTKKEVQPDMPDIHFHIETLPGDYTPPEDITKETKTRIEAGLKKVKPASKDILKKIRENNITIGLILCSFHDVVKAMKKELGFPIALTKEKVHKEFDRLAKEGGFLITTLGLTSSSLDLNECDNVFMMESTYSFPLDMQSVERCQRIGKKNEVNVYYYCLGGETSIAKSFSRQYLLDNLGRSKLSPSQLKRLEMCPGSYWLPTTDDKPEFIQSAADEGTQVHEIVERYLSNPSTPVPKSTHKNITEVVKYGRDLIGTCKYRGVESKVNLFTMHPELKGTVDFWALDGDTLHVMDYKNGSTSVSVKNNLQLMAYTLMILHTYGLSPKKIQHVIYQRNEKKTCFYQANVIKLWEKRIQRIIERIKKAEDEPLKHINQDSSCDFFCPAREYHNQKEEKVMTKQFTAADRKYPRATVTGKVFYAQKKKSKTGNPYLALGVSITELTDELKKAFKTGSKEQKALKAILEFNKEYQSYSFFLNGFPNSMKGDHNVSAKDEVEIEFKIKPPTPKFDRVSFDIVSIELLASDSAKENDDWGEGEVGEAETDEAPESVTSDPWG